MLPQLQVAVPDFEDWRNHTHSFAQMAAYTFQAMNHITLVGHGEPEVVQATNVTRRFVFHHGNSAAAGPQPSALLKTAKNGPWH